MQAKIKSIIVFVLGWGCVGLGIAGLFLPILQGILFLLIGFFILSKEYAWARKVLNKLHSRFPTVAGRFEVASKKTEDWLKQLHGRKTRSVHTNQQEQVTAKCGWTDTEKSRVGEIRSDGGSDLDVGCTLAGRSRFAPEPSGGDPWRPPA